MQISEEQAPLGDVCAPDHPSPIYPMNYGPNATGQGEPHLHPTQPTLAPPVPPVGPEKAVAQSKRCRNSVNITEDRNERSRRRKRQKTLPQETPPSRYVRFIHMWLEEFAFKNPSTNRTQASDVNIQQLQNLADLMYKDVGEVCKLVKQILHSDGRARLEESGSYPSIEERAAALSQKYADNAFTRECERSKRCEGKFQCVFNECEYRTKTVDALKRHMDVRMPSTVYVCVVCLSNSSPNPFIHQRTDKFRDHLKTEHQSGSTRKSEEKKSAFHPNASQPLRCGFCLDDFTKFLEFRDHVINHFKEGNPDYNNRDWNVRDDWNNESQLLNDLEEPQSATDEDNDENQTESDDDGSSSNEGNDDDDDDNGYSPNPGSSTQFHGPNGGSSGGPTSSTQRGSKGASQGRPDANYSGRQSHSCFSIKCIEPDVELSGAGLARSGLPILQGHQPTFIKTLGRGANGCVDMVQFESKGLIIARKSIANTGKVKASLKREITVLKHRSHPNIPRLMGSYIQGSTVNILMYPAAEMNLKELFDKSGEKKISGENVLAFCGQLASALQALHKPDSNNMGVRHGDIKPSNILVHQRQTTTTVYTELLLADFGASRFVSALDSESSSNCAMTPMYAAPEILKGDKHGRQADVFSLACVFLELVTSHLRSLDELMSRLQLSPTESQHSTRPISYSERIEDVITWIDELRQRATPNMLPVLDICEKMLAQRASQRPTANAILDSFATLGSFTKSHLDPLPFSWLTDCFEVKGEEDQNDESDLLKATQNPGSKSSQVLQNDFDNSSISSDDEVVLPERTASTRETDEAIRQKVVQQNSDFGQDPRDRALRSISNLESMQSSCTNEMAESVRMGTETMASNSEKTENVDPQDSREVEVATPRPDKFQGLQDCTPKVDGIGEMRLTKGDAITVNDQTSSGLWEGLLDGCESQGFFPSTFCAPLDNPDTNVDSSLDLVAFDHTSSDSSLPPSEEEMAVDGWRQLAAVSIYQAWSPGFGNMQMDSLQYLMSWATESTSALHAALMLFAHTRSAVQELMSLPHFYNHEIGEVCAELQKLEDILSELFAVIEWKDRMGSHIESLFPSITETGKCLRVVFSLRRTIFECDANADSELRLKLQHPSDLKYVSDCRKEIQSSNRVLDGMRSNCRLRDHSLVLFMKDGLRDGKTTDGRAGEYRNSLSRPLVEDVSPTPSEFSPATKAAISNYPDSDDVQLAPSVRRAYSQSSRVSTASSVISSDRSSVYSRASIASSTTSISSNISTLRKPMPLRPVRRLLGRANAYQGPQEIELLRYCSTALLSKPEWFFEDDKLRKMCRVEVRISNEAVERSGWYRDIRLAREQAAELALKKLTGVWQETRQAVDAMQRPERALSRHPGGLDSALRPSGAAVVAWEGLHS